MIGSAACWRRYGLILTEEYARPELEATRRFTVDAYAVQHPGHRSRPVIQSVGLHLARLMILLQSDLSSDAANGLLLTLGARKAALTLSRTTAQAFSMTVADIFPCAGTDRHCEAVRCWARATFDDWSATTIISTRGSTPIEHFASPGLGTIENRQCSMMPRLQMPILPPSKRIGARKRCSSASRPHPE